MNTTYRPDIDGLRAVAVLSVLLFHAFPQVLPGGFVGVDVFFVISGFLISGIILAQIADGSFTIQRFYARRIRRIFPALSLVLAAVAAFGWLSLAPYAFRQLGWHEMFSAAFGENLWLWQKSGDYFDEGSAVKPLLHLWSLGVEATCRARPGSSPALLCCPSARTFWPWANLRSSRSIGRIRASGS
jgi:peptidoglycan/LPS O-acetylase OafA/YrhL